jgi:hypothetical protein
MTMNTYIKRGVAAIMLLLVGALPAAAGDVVEFTLINASSQALHYFYAAPSTMAEWGNDLLGEDGTLEPGEQGTVTIGDGSDECEYDFRFESGKGAVLEVSQIDICSLNSYTLND